MKFILKSFFIFVLFFIGFINVSHAASTQGPCTYNNGSTSHCIDIKGYAWGADDKPFGGAGWINFNNTSSGSSTNTGGNASYKVEFDRDDLTLHGYAYSENYGYIKFGGFTEGAGNYPVAAACKGGTSTDNTDAKCNAQLVAVSGGYELVGYARFCFVYQSGCSGNIRPNYELGGYDGWIAFKGSNFAVTYNTSNVFQSYAWGGGHGTRGNSNYAAGMGWIKMNPSGGGLSCYVTTKGNDCISDSTDKPIIDIYTDTGVNPVNYNTTFTLKWKIDNIPNGCSATTSSDNTSMTGWNNYWKDHSIAGSSGTVTGSYTVTGGVSADKTTFNLECTYTTEKGNDSELIELNKFTPDVTLEPTSSITYGTSVDLTYKVTNVPFGCSGQLYKEGTPDGSPITITGDGTSTKEYTGTITKTPLVTTNWEFRCTDTTPPSPDRVGSDTAKTTVVVPTPTMTLSVKDTDTNSTTNIPCTNTGVTITYSTKDVKTGSCKAMYIPAGAGSAQALSGWDTGTSITENDYPTTHTSTTASITNTGGNVFYLQCQKLDGNPWTSGKSLSRSCTAGNLSVTGPSCITPTEMLNISYIGSGFNSGSCTMSWKTSPNNKINSSSFNANYVYPASNLTVGNQYTYTVSGCQESAYPGNAPMTSSVTVDVQNSCCPGGICTPPRTAPKFKEQ